MDVNNRKRTKSMPNLCCIHDSDSDIYLISPNKKRKLESEDITVTKYNETKHDDDKTIYIQKA